ncbi:MAG: NAD(+)/NADH kinase [Candidatus Schekmanbacteria bacterium]|nr:NAD(+)/NADH kinase [Candidatus Schekmanbacteria bacterium]
MRDVAIFAKPHDPRSPAVIRQLGEILRADKVNIRFDEATWELAERQGVAGAGGPRDAMTRGVDLVIVLGGDGTLLSVAREMADPAIPLLAVNLGSLGFLTEVRLDDLRVTLRAVLDGEFEVEERLMLSVVVRREGGVVASHRVLNDAVINKAALARIIDLEARVDECYVTTYKADGLIISTPTGSTAYSLSAGGPIVTPTLGAIILTPICPHTLTMRPLVIRDDSAVAVTLGDHSCEVTLTLDGQVGVSLSPRDVVLVSSAQERLHLLRSPRADFFSVLRTKLRWGER